ncbi:putative E3 ubiquitin ligase protein [Dioscorea alata]|uniref:E3 ubiquitin ligase protein n=1 Tax=Dioscorea alata TaxID=55571 RepID=A0ACB7WGS3_DIOAL|nr:putative E3 ubiquitin ligase protein [Dioscorea alata]
MENSRNTGLRPGDEIPNPTSSSTTAGDESLPGSPPSPSSANPSSRLSQIDSDFEFACMLHELENSRNADISTEPGPGDENHGLTSSSSSITGGAESSPPLPGSSATSSSRLSQIDEDYAFACMLQQQEGVLMMLRNDGEFEDEQPSGEGGQEEGEVSTEELDAHPEQPGEALGRALDLFEAEVLQAALQLMSSSSLDEWRTMSQMIQPNLNFQGNQQYPDFNNPSYEELSALCEMVGSVNKGLSEDKIFSLPSISYKASENGSTDECVICLLNFEDGDSLVSLSCEHLYHCDCIRKWLLTNKACPICNAEVNFP